VSAIRKVVVDEDEVRTLLSGYSLPTIEQIHAVFLDSNAARATCTGLDPITFAGTTMSGVAVRSLRRIVLSEGWTMTNRGGLSLTVSPDKKRAIAVSTGSSGTGKEKGFPRTKSKKGKKMVEAITAPGMQFAMIELIGPTPEKEPEPDIWILLYRYVRPKRKDDDRRRIYIELSQPHPDGINKRGRIVGWSERLIIPPLDINKRDTGIRTRVPEGPQIDVDVFRRAL
jgi:hypothetical protein